MRTGCVAVRDQWCCLLVWLLAVLAKEVGRASIGRLKGVEHKLFPMCLMQRGRREGKQKRKVVRRKSWLVRVGEYWWSGGDGGMKVRESESIRVDCEKTRDW